LLTRRLCGTGSPLADAKRAGPCIAVVAGKHLYIVDAGEGSTKNINLMGFQAGKIDAVLLTHFHSDHLQTWANLKSYCKDKKGGTYELGIRDY